MKKHHALFLALAMSAMAASCTTEQPTIIQAECPETASSAAPEVAECRTEADFLNSPDGVAFQIAAFRAAKAYLESAEQGDDLFRRIDYIILKWSLDDIKSEDSIRASYEFALSGEDSVSYVTMELTKTAGQWQVTTIGLEK